MHVFLRTGVLYWQIKIHFIWIHRKLQHTAATPQTMLFAILDCPNCQTWASFLDRILVHYQSVTGMAKNAAMENVSHRKFVAAKGDGWFLNALMQPWNKNTLLFHNSPQISKVKFHYSKYLTDIVIIGLTITL